MVSRRKILIYLTILICFLALVSLGATKFYWYQSIWWFDMPMHFLGGLFVSFLLIYLFYSTTTKQPIAKSAFLLLLGVLAVGVGWEIFEYIFNNVIGGQIFNPLDTLSDIFFDMAGAIIGIFICYNKRQNE